MFIYFHVVKNCAAVSDSHTHTHTQKHITVQYGEPVDFFKVGVVGSPISLAVLYGILRFLQRQSVSKELLKSSSVLKTSSRQCFLSFFLSPSVFILC